MLKILSFLRDVLMLLGELFRFMWEHMNWKYRTGFIVLFFVFVVLLIPENWYMSHLMDFLKGLLPSTEEVFDWVLDNSTN